MGEVFVYSLYGLFDKHWMRDVKLILGRKKNKIARLR